MEVHALIMKPSFKLLIEYFLNIAAGSMNPDDYVEIEELLKKYQQ